MIVFRINRFRFALSVIVVRIAVYFRAVDLMLILRVPTVLPEFLGFCLLESKSFGFSCVFDPAYRAFFTDENGFTIRNVRDDHVFIVAYAAFPILDLKVACSYIFKNFDMCCDVFSVHVSVVVDLLNMLFDLLNAM